MIMMMMIDVTRSISLRTKTEIANAVDSPQQELIAFFNKPQSTERGSSELNNFPSMRCDAMQCMDPSEMRWGAAMLCYANKYAMLCCAVLCCAVLPAAEQSDHSSARSPWYYLHRAGRIRSLTYSILLQPFHVMLWAWSVEFEFITLTRLRRRRSCSYAVTSWTIRRDNLVTWVYAFIFGVERGWELKSVKNIDVWWKLFE